MRTQPIAERGESIAITYSLGGKNITRPFSLNYAASNNFPSRVTK